MQEDLKYIELIDKYLSGTLNPSEKEWVDNLLLNDSKFVKEVAVYKKIYEGIERKEEADLKKRLGSYFEVYEKDQKVVIANIPKGKYRRLFTFGSAIAACLIIGGSILFFSTNKDQDSNLNRLPGVVDLDTITFKKNDSLKNPREDKQITQEELPNKIKDENKPNEGLVNDDEKQNIERKDSTVYQNNIDNTQLALGGFKTLLPNSVREYSYSKLLLYTFKDDEVKIYGDPLMSRLDLLSIQILKNEKLEYLLNFKNEYYLIKKTGHINKLLKVKEEKKNTGFSTFFSKKPKLTPTQEEVSIKLVGVSESSHVLQDLNVNYMFQAIQNETYFFNEKGNGLELILNANLNPKSAKVFKIREEEKNYYYLIQESSVYELDANVKEPKPLIPVDVKTNKLARLFIEREPVKVSVYKLD